MLNSFWARCSKCGQMIDTPQHELGCKNSLNSKGRSKNGKKTKEKKGRKTNGGN